ncbi:LacI family DNA-binding transcriptional regulator [Salinicola aestuarinus]|uniref:LacI family DNA-binding transcriptional regulator n=1 Tax=Salinicola aestuarinus TaxID=1949082 RepID=UPI0024782C3B|nr:substrate-binding domain-containing protein [Salinicola aestuarinus]
MVVPDISTPFFATLVAAVETEADSRGLSLALHATLNRPEREATYLDLIRQGHVDGLIFVTNHVANPALAEKLNSAGPCVVVDEDVVGAHVPKLFCDNEQGGYLAGRHLAESGHRHVLFVGGVDQMVSGARRYQGFERGMREVAADDVLIERSRGDYSFEAGREAGRAFISRGRGRPTAIFATSDELVIGLYEALGDSELSIPRDVSIVGFDDVGPLHLFAPPVTAVRQPVRDLGKYALALLLDAEPMTPAPPSNETLLPVTLIERQSVAPPP